MSGGFKVLRGIKGGKGAVVPDNPYCSNPQGCRNDGDCSHTTNGSGCHNVKTCASL
jgi:hypothetical protein